MMMAWSQNHDMFKGFNKWHILGAFCFVFFVCRFLKRGQNDDQCLFCIVFWVQNCVSFYYANCFFYQLPSKKFMSRSDKKGFVCLFFVQLKVGGDANIFVLFLSFWLFGSKLIFTWLKTSRLLWQLWKRCPVVKDCSPITNRFFEWIIWWWS